MERERRRLATLLLAFSGVLASHGLAYVIAHPDQAGRAAALDGHGYLSTLGVLAVPLVTVALGWASVRAARTAVGADGLTIGRLALWQTAAFVVQEVGERAVAGEAGQVLHEPAIAVGLLLQVPVAAALIGLVRCGRHVIENPGTVGPRPRRAIAPVPVIGALDHLDVVACPVQRTPVMRRGPPSVPLPD